MDGSKPKDDLNDALEQQFAKYISRAFGVPLNSARVSEIRNAESGLVEIKIDGQVGGGFFDRMRPYYGRNSDRAAERISNELSIAREKVAILQNSYDRAVAFIDGLNTEPSSLVTVLGAGAKPKKWLVRRGAETLEVQGPDGISLKPGDTVRVLSKTMNILDRVDVPPTSGEVVRVAVVVDETTCEVLHGPSTRAVLTGVVTVNAGDRVVLDMSNTVVLRNLGPEKTEQAISVETGVSWDDIGGQDEAKAALREAVEGPVLRKEIYARYGRRPTKGVLLFGPPGNGKTMLGKAAATALAAMHGASAKSTGFLYVRGPEILSQWVGGAEAAVRALFDTARRHKAEHGYPAVIFLDEAESLLGKRGMTGSVLSHTIVPMFLAEMDGMIESGALVLLATNRPDVLDPAIVREGRIDRKVFVARPSRADACEVFGRYLSGRPLAGALEELIVEGVDALYSSARVLYKISTKNKTKTLTLGHVTSGAQIAGIVETAASFAVERELAEDAAGDIEGPRQLGIIAADLRAAVDRVFDEQRLLEHDDDIERLAETFVKPGDQLMVEKMRASLTVEPDDDADNVIPMRGGIKTKEGKELFTVTRGGEA